jgi:GntR family transcriptional regulator
LVQRGLIEIRRGKVTHQITQELTELTGFVEDMQALGRHATAEVLDQQVVAANQVVARQLACADATVARALCIGVGSAIFLIERTSYSIGD